MSGRSFLLDVAGGRRRIRVFEAGDGPPLVFLHGAGGLVEESPFLAALGRRWHVFAPLLPGYGDSEGGDTLPDMLAITLHSFDVIEALGLARPHLVGHSMGGAVVLAVAARDPGRVASLTLIAPSGFGSEINADYLRGFADAQTRRELKPVVGQLFADEGLVTRQLVDDLLAYKRLDGVDESLHALLDTLLDGDAQRGDSAAALAAVLDTGAARCRSPWSGARRPDHPGGAG